MEIEIIYYLRTTAQFISLKGQASMIEVDLLAEMEWNNHSHE